MQHLGRAKRLHHRFQLKCAQFLSFRRFHHRPVRRRRALLSATPLLFMGPWDSTERYFTAPAVMP